MKYLFILLLGATSFNQTKASDLQDYLFKNSNKKIATHSILIQKEGEVLFEKFLVGKQDTRHLLWSMSKTLSSLIFGIAEDRGLVSKEDSIYKYYKKEIDSQGRERVERLKKIKLKHLIGMSSGLHWNEYYEKSPFNSHVVRMLYFHNDMAQYVINQKVKHVPGSFFYYSSGDTNLLMGALTRAIPKDLKGSYPWDFLFTPMDLNGVFERDKAGTFLGSSYAYLNTKDLAKVGQLILDNGSYKGSQIISKSYMLYFKTLTEPMGSSGVGCLKHHRMTYGASVWLNHPCANGDKPFKDAPDDMIMLRGYRGQSVFIFPTQKIIAVRIADDVGNSLDENTYAKLILKEYGAVK